MSRGLENTVLIVDDDGRVRALMTRLLGQAGFVTREAATGEEALAAAREQKPRLVLLEISLPGLSGYEVLRELRDSFGEGLPVAFVTGVRTDHLDRVAGLLLGADDYLVKPFSPDEFLARVRALLRRSRPGEDRAGLTPRELDVLRLLAQGLAQDEIAEREDGRHPHRAHPRQARCA